MTGAYGRMLLACSKSPLSPLSEKSLSISITLRVVVLPDLTCPEVSCFPISVPSLLTSSADNSLNIETDREKGYAYTIGMLPLFASFRPRVVTLTRPQLLTTAEGRSVDRILSGFRTPIKCAFGAHDWDPLSATRCGLETWYALLPRCAQKGVLSRECGWNPEECHFHYKLKVSETYRTLPLREKVLVGFPPGMRGDIWAELSGFTFHTPWLTDVCEGLQSMALVEACESATIQADVAVFKKTHPRVKKALVSRVVAIYLTATADVKYSSELLDVAGFMCLYRDFHGISNAEHSFAVFHWLTQIHIRPYLCGGDSQIERDAAQIKTSLQSNDPNLAKVLFVDLSICPLALCRAWIPRAFVNVLPDDNVARVWDILFSGGVAVLLQTALAIINLCKSSLITTTSQSTAMDILLKPPLSLLPPLSEKFLNVVLSVELSPLSMDTRSCPSCPYPHLSPCLHVTAM
ncbi:rab-GTPase-TBC domain-containing protein [Cristinia sonorae]|uniref:Rab-GTPase-TBC domain-containing protein n=1 Tax=Cristinia sonorae TaxID=1940300 RepID=A0A8K0UH08_9AGAR|nr:rab-GTPase-TBC domain-containing protein [Cristinia sonorae]